MSTACRHEVVFYDDRCAIDARVAAYVRDGIRWGDVVALITTSATVTAVDADLRAHGHDPDELRRAGRLRCWDAEETLASLRTADAVDWAAVEAFAAGLASAAVATGRGLRLYGEMVALLWSLGCCDLAVSLERRWDELAARHDIDLLCAYPAGVTVTDGAADQVNAICELHTGIGSEHHPGVTVALRSYPPDPRSVRDARHFVRDLLGDEHHGALVDNAMLITSELAANAVEHAGTVYAVQVERRPGRVAISARDGSPTSPIRKQPPPDTPDGRGINIVTALAAQVEIRPASPGKVVRVTLAT